MIAINAVWQTDAYKAESFESFAYKFGAEEQRENLISLAKSNDQRLICQAILSFLICGPSVGGKQLRRSLEVSGLYIADSTLLNSTL